MFMHANGPPHPPSPKIYEMQILAVHAARALVFEARCDLYEKKRSDYALCDLQSWCFTTGINCNSGSYSGIITLSEGAAEPWILHADN